jgi:hypothetical protein
MALPAGHTTAIGPQYEAPNRVGRRVGLDSQSDQGQQGSQIAGWCLRRYWYGVGAIRVKDQFQPQGSWHHPPVLKARGHSVKGRGQQEDQGFHAVQGPFQFHCFLERFRGRQRCDHRFVDPPGQSVTVHPLGTQADPKSSLVDAGQVSEGAQAQVGQCVRQGGRWIQCGNRQVSCGLGLASRGQDRDARPGSCCYSGQARTTCDTDPDPE